MAWQIFICAYVHVCGELSATVIGTFFLPGSHTNGIPTQDDHELGVRVTYQHNALIFDSLVQHYGPAGDAPVYKYGII
jgi:hypothetical protein